MTASERYPVEQSDAALQRDMVLGSFLVGQKILETDTDSINAIWADLSPAEQDVRTAVVQHFFPDDIAARQNAMRCILSIGYFMQEAALTSQLESMLAMSN